jgi:xanthine dehydrogenase molybdopterin-binding subunit B
LNTAVIGHEAEAQIDSKYIAWMSIWSESAYHGIRGPKGVGRGRLIEAIANAMDKDIVRLDLRDCQYLAI